MLQDQYRSALAVSFLLIGTLADEQPLAAP